MCKNSQFKNINGACVPTCEEECINAKCISPNVCECLPGYKSVSESTCEPICSSCENGECVGPEQCECHEGYANGLLADGSENKSVCQPTCAPECINSHCIKPNFCECAINTARLSSYECVSIDENDSKCNSTNCQNGSCVNGECICLDQYELQDGKCRKLCNLTCEHGKCLDDKCSCDDGYKLSEDEKQCNPVCAFEDGHDCKSDIICSDESIYSVLISPFRY